MAYKINTTIKDALKLAGGGIVGAGVALLLAPRTGKETRKDIIRFAKTAGRKTDRAAHELGYTLSDFASTVAEKGSGMLHEGREMIKRVHLP
jgi:gas vesicle protein